MSGVFGLRDYDALCRSVFGTELPFPDTETPAGEGFIIGNNRPKPEVQHYAKLTPPDGASVDLY